MSISPPPAAHKEAESFPVPWAEQFSLKENQCNHHHHHHHHRNNNNHNNNHNNNKGTVSNQFAYHCY